MMVTMMMITFIIRMNFTYKLVLADDFGHKQVNIRLKFVSSMMMMMMIMVMKMTMIMMMMMSEQHPKSFLEVLHSAPWIYTNLYVLLILNLSKKVRMRAKNLFRPTEHGQGW